MDKAISTLRDTSPGASRGGGRYLAMAIVGLLLAIASALLSARG